MKCLLSLSILFLALTTSLKAQVSVGEEAPDFTHDVLGERSGISLTDLRGKVVYIFFYGAGCPHCLSNGPATVDQIYDHFKDDDNFAALGLDAWNYSIQANANFREQTGIPYPLLLNAEQTLVAYYGSAAYYDRSVVVDSKGLLVYKGNGYVSTDTDKVRDAISAALDSIGTSSEREFSLPSSIQLHQNYPNPFNPTTSIGFSLNQSGMVSLKVYDLLGKHIATLVDEVRPAGEYVEHWNASDVPSGIYLYRLRSGDQSLTRKMTLIK